MRIRGGSCPGVRSFGLVLEQQKRPQYQASITHLPSAVCQLRDEREPTSMLRYSNKRASTCLTGGSDSDRADTRDAEEVDGLPSTLKRLPMADMARASLLLDESTLLPVSRLCRVLLVSKYTLMWGSVICTRCRSERNLFWDLSYPLSCSTLAVSPGSTIPLGLCSRPASSPYYDATSTMTMACYGSHI